MVVSVYKWFSVFIFSMLKFVGGPLTGMALGLNISEIIILTVLGMMTSVIIFSTGGIWIRKRFLVRFGKKKVLFTKKNRNIVKVWRKYGIAGVALLTPILFTPIGGTMIVISFGEPVKKVLIYMFISAVLWAFLITFSLHYLGTMLGLVK